MPIEGPQPETFLTTYGYKILSSLKLKIRSKGLNPFSQSFIKRMFNKSNPLWKNFNQTLLCTRMMSNLREEGTMNPKHTLQQANHNSTTITSSKIMMEPLTILMVPNRTDLIKASHLSHPRIFSLAAIRSTIISTLWTTSCKSIVKTKEHRGKESLQRSMTKLAMKPLLKTLSMTIKSFLPWQINWANRLTISRDT